MLWLLQALGASALISVALAATQKIQHASVDWVLITVGFCISSLILYLSLAVPHWSSLIKKRTSNHDDPGALVDFLSSIRPADQESALAGESSISADGTSGALAPDARKLLRALGVVEFSNGRDECVSESADAFLASLRASILDGNSQYFGDWSAAKTAERSHLVSMLEQWEEYRVRSAPGGSARPSRKVTAACALIRADLNGEPRFVMLKNPTWNRNNPLWFVGGTQKPGDKLNLRRTIIREACEELALRPEDIRSPQSRGRASDRRISKRFGLFTEYNYEMFALQLVTTNPTLLVVSGRLQTEERVEEFQWCTWNEILSSDHLNASAPSLIGLLRQIDPLSIPLSGQLRPT